VLNIVTEGTWPSGDPNGPSGRQLGVSLKYP
jgi:hypothetical protein